MLDVAVRILYFAVDPASFYDVYPLWVSSILFDAGTLCSAGWMPPSHCCCTGASCRRRYHHHRVLTKACRVELQHSSGIEQLTGVRKVSLRCLCIPRLTRPVHAATTCAYCLHHLHVSGDATRWHSVLRDWERRSSHCLECSECTNPLNVRLRLYMVGEEVASADPRFVRQYKSHSIPHIYEEGTSTLCVSAHKFDLAFVRAGYGRSPFTSLGQMASYSLLSSR